MARGSSTSGDGAPSGAPDPNTIPEELRARRQWVCWRAEQRDGKRTKVPLIACGPKNRGAASGTQRAFRASSTDPSTWRSFEEAAHVAAEAGFGVGYVFADTDPFCGVDLDSCFDEHGELHPDAARVVDMLGSWAERSPSRTGLHVIVRAELNGRPRHRTDEIPWGGQLEVYDRGRYFTVTGHHLEDTGDLVEHRQAELDRLLDEFLPTKPAAPPTPRVTSGRSDSEVLARAFAAKNGPKLMALYRGDRSGYKSDSQSDQALVSMLAYWTRDPDQLDRLFRGSGLMRDKWDRPDYRDRTIAKALESGDCFDWGRQPKPARKVEELTNLTVAKILESAGEDDAEGALSELAKLLQGQSQASQIVQLVLERDGTVLFHDEDEVAYASIGVDGHSETYALRSRAFKLWVRRLFYEEYEAAPNGTALGDAIGVLEGKALFEGRTVPVNLRVAGDDHAIVIDLGDDQWRAVRITRDGWEVLDHHPVRFRRSGGMAALPVPQPGGAIDHLREFVNVDDAGFRLLVGWLVAALRPDSPYPVLNLAGEQGSAKSTVAKALRALVDPSSVPLHAPPHDKTDLMVAAANSWTVAVDNVSSIPKWLSDSLCRLSTGGGMSKRMLYTDGDEFLLGVKRPVILNGIGELAEESDLLDRSLMVECPVIAAEARMREDEFWARFAEQQPVILGGLYDAVAHALGHVDDVELDRLPRMADFATWLVAAEPALGWEPGSFLATYDTNRDEVHELAVEASVVGAPLLEVASGGYDGTMASLLELLASKVDEKVTKRRDWPKSPRGLRNHVTRLAPNLRELGVEVTFSRESGSGNRVVSIERLR